MYEELSKNESMSQILICSGIRTKIYILMAR